MASLKSDKVNLFFEKMVLWCDSVKQGYVALSVICFVRERSDVMQKVPMLRCTVEKSTVGDDAALQFVSQMQMIHSLRLQPGRQKWKGDGKGK